MRRALFALDCGSYICHGKAEPGEDRPPVMPFSMRGSLLNWDVDGQFGLKLL
jgi:hypothetical protein